MNYWHIQLHPDNKGAFPIEKVRKILEEKSLIGLGEWPEGEAQIRQFKDTMKIDDVVVVRSGQSPIALVQVVGDSEYTDDVDEDFDWFQNRRKIKILDFYSDKDNFIIPKGQGTLSICSNHEVATSKVIINWYKRILESKDTKNVEKLLRYKHQIILQGPPGTGKTRLAKIVAKEFTKPKNIGSPETIIDDLVKSFNPNEEDIKATRSNNEKLLNEFQELFPKETLNKLTLQNYCAGRGDRNNFCWWIERGLKTLGYYSPGSARSYLIFWKKEIEDYSKHGFVKGIEDNDEAMKKIADLLFEVVSTKNAENAIHFFGDSFLLKLLNSYYPEEYFPINSEKMIDNALKIFNFDIKGLNAFDKNKALNNIYLNKKKQFNSQINGLEFSRILFEKFNIKYGEHINTQTGIVTDGEFQIIQFHPSYSYEDFVRGIVAGTDDSGNISYHVENKILADFAQKAKDNPNGDYVLIIDEINRANLPSVFGELIYTLEYRGESVTSMYEYDDERDIVLPNNFFIIGTMNTADRSVGHIDYAIRRRFAFVDVLPDENVIKNSAAKRLFSEVKELFSQTYLSPDFKAKDVMIGHSYFLGENEDELRIKLEYEIKPILREYLRDGIFFEIANTKIESLNV